MEEIEILGRDGARIDQHLEVEDFLPVIRSINKDGDPFVDLPGLRQREDLEHLVEGAEAAGKNHQRLGQIGEPQLAHEEVVELEVERGRDVGIGPLLEGQQDVHADGFAAGLVRAAVGRFHNAGTAAGGDDETMLARGDGFGPLREQLRQAARVFVVARHLHGGHGALELQNAGAAGCDLACLGRLLVAGRRIDRASVFQELQGVIGLFAPAEARRAEEDHRVLNLLAAEARQRLQILRDDADGTAVGAVEERGVFKGQRRGIERWRRAVAGNDSLRGGINSRGLKTCGLRTCAGFLLIHNVLLPSLALCRGSRPAAPARRGGLLPRSLAPLFPVFNRPGVEWHPEMRSKDTINFKHAILSPIQSIQTRDLLYTPIQSISNTQSYYRQSNQFQTRHLIRQSNQFQTSPSYTPIINEINGKQKILFK